MLKMENKIKIVIGILLVGLMLPMVVASELSDTINYDKAEVFNEYVEFWGEDMYNYTEVSFNYKGEDYVWEYAAEQDYETFKGQFGNMPYDDWIDLEFEEAFYRNFEEVENITAEIVSEDVEYEGETLWSKILNLITSKIDALTGRTDMLESELCKKDNTYSWC
jgi:hypothetical protein